MRDADVPSQEEAPSKGSGRVVLFPGRSRKPRPEKAAASDAGAGGVADLRKYEQDPEPDDFPRRMAINAAAFAFIIMLTLAGVWLAEQMAMLRKNQDCTFIGRKNCPEATALKPSR